VVSGRGGDSNNQIAASLSRTSYLTLALSGRLLLGSEGEHAEAQVWSASARREADHRKG
jgi:hypothetical protein